MYNNPYNFYPYMNNMPINMVKGNLAKPSLLSGIKNIKWGNVLNNTQKTLNVINQAIPVYYQIKPIWQNVKSFSKIITAFNEPEKVEINQTPTPIKEEKKENSFNQPTFFIN